EKKSAPNSYYYFIEGGPVQIEVNDLETHKALRHNLHSAADREYRRLRKYYSSVVDTVTGAVPDLPAKQRLMKSYIAAHPDSYVALWDLVLDVSQARTDDDKRCLMANTALFSAAVKRSNTWRALAHDLEKELTLVVGKVFPELPVQPALSMATTTAMHRYTLVEFWYSHCRPCLEQAPAWKEVYKQVKDKGVAFLGISVDKEEHRGDWRKAIETVGMDWPQFLDVNGVEADRINVRVFPSNFLLDEKGIILKKDITPQELQAFLEAKAGQ
ncbi:MAG: TlpA family protein disulfide reductase, partial [Chitinophagaceae bacterium]